MYFWITKIFNKFKIIDFEFWFNQIQSNITNKWQKRGFLLVWERGRRDVEGEFWDAGVSVFASEKWAQRREREERGGKWGIEWRKRNGGRWGRGIIVYINCVYLIYAYLYCIINIYSSCYLYIFIYSIKHLLIM